MNEESASKRKERKIEKTIEKHGKFPVTKYSRIEKKISLKVI